MLGYPQMVESNYSDDLLDNEWAFESDDGWGWEVEIDGETVDPALPKSPGVRISLKPTVPRQMSRSQESESSIISRVKSSSSFQELERAIGATLAMGLVEVDLSKKDEHIRMINGVISHKATLGKNLRMRSYNSLSRLRSDSIGISREASSSSLNESGAAMRLDLKPFLDEPESRAIIIFHSTDVIPYDIKSACQNFGSLYYFRSDFHSFGITLVCYFDIRCAIDAQRSLRARLGRLADANPHFSVILHSSNGCDESKLCVSRVPSSKAEADIQSVFARYGQLKSIQKSFNDRGVTSTIAAGGNPSDASCDYTIEYFNMQDAKIAMSELNSSIHNVIDSESDVYFVPFEKRQEQARKDALNVLHSWRRVHEELEGSSSASQRLLNQATKSASITPLTASNPALVHSSMPVASSITTDKISSPAQSSRPPSSKPKTARHLHSPVSPVGGVGISTGASSSSHASIRANAPLPPGHMFPPYSGAMPIPYAVPNIMPMAGMYPMMAPPYYDPNTGSVYGPVPGMMPMQMHIPQQGSAQDHYNQSRYAPPMQHYPGAYFVPAYGGAMPMHFGGGSLPVSPLGSYENLQFAMDGDSEHGYDGGKQSSHGHGRRGGSSRNHLDSGERRPPHHNGGHSGVGGNARRGGKARTSPEPATVDHEYLLNPERLVSGNEKRTTVMIRNIPNKYTQSMLLEEINAKFDGMYDFFYLPIDFKNKCNVGYAFVNFLDPNDVGRFSDEFNGQRWRNFNSEKVCGITYARIQGKAAMIARFQNSSLLEKDDSYKPLLFVSKGPNKGAPEPFPSSRSGEQTQSVGVGNQQTSPSGQAYF